MVLKLVKFLKIEKHFQNQEFMDRQCIKYGVRESEGACSIVLSGGYEDDIDDLNYIQYTGQGGQNYPSLGKQVKDQESFKIKDQN